MSPDSDLNEEHLKEMLRFRRDIYNNLAKDALTILSIQLFIIPISVSATSLIIQVLKESEQGSGTQNVIKRLAENLDYTFLGWGLVIGVGAIIVSLLAYHMSRKVSAEQPSLFFEYIQSTPEETTGGTTDDGVIPRLKSTYSDLADTPSAAEMVHSEFRDIDNSTYTLIRIYLTLSLIASLVSLVLCLIAVVKAVYSQSPIILLGIIGSVVILLPMSIYVYVTIFGIEKAVEISKSINIIGEMVHIIKKFYQNYPRTLCATIFFIIIFYISQIPAIVRFSRALYEFSYVLLIGVGLLLIIFFVFEMTRGA